MSSAPTTITITYVSAFTNGVGSAQSTATLPIRAGTDYNNTVRNIFLSGGFWFTSASGVPTFVPWGQVISITAQ